MEYWSVGVLGAKAEKILFYILSLLFPIGTKQDSFFSLLRYSITPILRIQLTSAFDKKADNCRLPTAVIYTPWRAGPATPSSANLPASSGSNAAPACRGGRETRVMSLAGHFVALSGGNYYGAKPTNTASIREPGLSGLSIPPCNATWRP